jgi:hypothetical protein
MKIYCIISKEGNIMIKMLKNLFSKKQEEAYVPDPPGRTFNKVLTGRFFGCEDKNADAETIAKAKKDTIDQIQELELVPMFVRFTYDDTTKNESEEEKHPTAAHVAFQKEVFAENWNMIHITEISFIVNSSDFDEFEKMAGVSLTKDFRDLTNTMFTGKDRRKEERNR